MLLVRLDLPGQGPCFGRVPPHRPREIELLSPAVKDGKVYFATSDSALFHALDAKSGAEIFSLKLTWPMFGSPAIGQVASLVERGLGLMRTGMSEDALRLVGPNGALPRELERPLLALAAHRRLRGPVIWSVLCSARLLRKTIKS